MTIASRSASILRPAPPNDGYLRAIPFARSCVWHFARFDRCGLVAGHRTALVGLDGSVRPGRPADGSDRSPEKQCRRGAGATRTAREPRGAAPGPELRL